MTIELTKEELEFITNLLKQLQVNPAQPDIGKVVAIVQSLMCKLTVKE